MSGRFRLTATTFAFVWFALVATPQSAPRPESDDGRRWLITENSPSSPLETASRANAFNQNETAERLLRGIIQREPRSPEASDAHKLLSRIYVRTGRYKQATSNLAEWLQNFPDSADARREERDVAQFRELPDQNNGPRRPSVLNHQDDLWVPVSVNGKENTFLLDTGAWVSVITQQAAERVGLEFRGAATLGDSSGKGVVTRTAVAKDLVVGNMRFQNVSFFVIPDGEPFTSLPLDRRGIIGIPIQLGLGTWQWSRAGTMRVGEMLPRQAPPNLVFFRNKGLVSVEISERSVFLTLDSGASGTDLNSNFVENFGHLLDNAQKTTREITGLGGTSTFDAYTLLELGLSVAGRTLTLRPADVTVQKTAGIGGECCIGNFGNDLLTQTGGFTLDFDNMSLTLR